MTVVRFKSVAVTRTAPGDILIALFNGEPVPACVGMIACSEETAHALVAALGIELQGQP
jgi:hypothetical protein